MLFQGKNSLRASVAMCALAATCSLPVVLQAQETPPQSSTSPDNSGHNKAHARTADQQSSASADRELTAKIRRSLIADKSLSTYGHNVKIITQQGAVTLKGPVHSEQEKQAIASKAEEVAGQGKVTDQLTVKQ